MREVRGSRRVFPDFGQPALFVFLVCGHGGDPNASMVAAVELTTMTIQWSAPLGTPMPQDVQISPDGHRLYVSQYYPNFLCVFEH